MNKVQVHFEHPLINNGVGGVGTNTRFNEKSRKWSMGINSSLRLNGEPVLLESAPQVVTV